MHKATEAAPRHVWYSPSVSALRWAVHRTGPGSAPMPSGVRRADDNRERSMAVKNIQQVVAGAKLFPLRAPKGALPRLGRQADMQAGGGSRACPCLGRHARLGGTFLVHQRTCWTFNMAPRGLESCWIYSPFGEGATAVARGWLTLLHEDSEW
jgi:hypothetical protein